MSSPENFNQDESFPFDSFDAYLQSVPPEQSEEYTDLFALPDTHPGEWADTMYPDFDGYSGYDGFPIAQDPIAETNAPPQLDSSWDGVPGSFELESCELDRYSNEPRIY
jgi:hypothetical protein